MREQAEQNKTAWEYRAYEFWNQLNGTPAEFAAEIKANSDVRLIHRKYFENVTGKKIANPCGSNGRQAVKLAYRGNEVTIFDISEENKRYALELAKEAGVNIEYILGDFCETDLTKYGNMFDIVYPEGGILHYFSDIDAFTKTLYAITKPNGILILSDYHPYRKINGLEQTEGDYFDSRWHNRNVAYQDEFPQEEQALFPKCICRYFTLSEIINSVIASGFTIKEFIEHPHYEDTKRPGEFTIIAYKI
ncbi:MAG: class I SAM-dependent methyltransferase [Oscillospiraceae bacterium]|nr:class I SAM-dependent methyltransferase [Oscillospiraceae bacterium]